MKRTVIVVILAGAAMVLLLSAAVQWRSVPPDLHIAQHTVATEIAIVEEIVRSHGGELLIESEIQKGSPFTVVLPIEQATTSVLVQANERKSPAANAQDALGPDAELAKAV